MSVDEFLSTARGGFVRLHRSHIERPEVKKRWMIAIPIGRPRYSHECIEDWGESVLCFPFEEEARGVCYLAAVKSPARSRSSC